MSPINFEAMDTDTAKNGHHLGDGMFGDVFGWGPYVVKVGFICHDEFTNLNRAHKLLGDAVPEAYRCEKNDDFSPKPGLLIMDRVPGAPLADHPEEISTVLDFVDGIFQLYGMCHGDLHAHNVLIDELGHVYCVDGASFYFDFVE